MLTLLNHMNKFLFFSLIILFFSCENEKSGRYLKKVIKNDAEKNAEDCNQKKLLTYYPQIEKIEKNVIFFKNGDKLIYDDGTKKSFLELIENPDVEDQFFFLYPKNESLTEPIKNFDPGRIRNEEFFKIIYGKTKREVEQNLVEIVWCPKLVGEKILVSKINNVHKKLVLISKELDEHPEYKKYISNIGGTFNWRNIKGSERMSMHSFGVTIDINVGYSDYWQWSCGCEDELMSLKYNNKIPIEIVRIFEKHGFIWGGRWYHFDTMHFEYRPELLENCD
jgi:hypothetical protein